VTAPSLLQAAEPASRAVTSWPERVGLTVGVLAVLALAFRGMRRGWLRRARRFADLPAPPPLVGPPGELLAGPFDGRFLGTTVAGDWLDRVVAHGLGTPSSCRVAVRGDGVSVERGGAPGLLVPLADLVGARLDKGLAGRVYEDGGVVVVTWVLGGRELDTGLRLAGPDDGPELVDAVGRLLVPSAGGPA